MTRRMPCGRTADHFAMVRSRAAFVGTCVAFLAVNAALSLANVVAGASWWAFWPLVVTAFLLGLHYLAYKAMTANEQWAEERVEELNLKSYDRSHIEELKARLGPGNTGADRRRLSKSQ